MNTQQLIDQVKLKLDDVVTPRIFSDTAILTALNDAQNEFANRTLCLFSDDVEVTGRAGTGTISLPAGILWVTAVSSTLPLRIVNSQELDYGYFSLNGVEEAARFTNWRQASGTPSFCILEYGIQAMRLVPKPDINVTLALEYYRLPTAEIALSPEVLAEIPTPYHADLVIGALAYLYEIPNLETYDKDAATLRRSAWNKRIAIAAGLLQTALRMQVRVLPPPPGVGFTQLVGE